MHTLNSEIRELDIVELDAVSGGRNALVAALIAAWDAIHSVERTLAEGDGYTAPYVPMAL
jgi:hypothetical protein